ncbi:uncharacterized protein [Chironomus tepperi]|uniref:uncharacterized protein n=1 Tax=Chironomus tepperi TaxID=113505 RepID=UPI00391F15E2
MHLKLGIILIISLSYSVAFIPYPFVTNYLLESFLKDIKADQIDLDNFTIGTECQRKCIPNDRRICHFNMTIKSFQIMGGACQNCTDGDLSHCFHSKCIMADGIRRGFLSVNHQLPAPAIHVCKDDVIVVDLTNDASGTATSIHWHGIRHILGTQYFDGTPYLTQCPIPYGNKFRYAFTADDEGTHFYHSHSGHQKANGIFGALVVRAPDNTNPNRHLYDYDLPEHIIIASDWMHHLAEDDFPGIVSRSQLTQSILINGHGRFFNQTSKKYQLAPLTIYHVEPNMKYRFRFINSAFNVCPFLLQVEHHEMSIIATEISYVEPFTIDALYSLTGERFDFVINANKTPGDYWIRLQTMAPCRIITEGFAVLRYRNSSGGTVDFVDKDPPRESKEFSAKKIFNSPKPKIKDIPFLELNAYEYDESIIKSDPDHKFYLFLDSPTLSDDALYSNQTHFRMSYETTKVNFNNIGTFNNISLLYPSFPLLTQPEMIDETMFCNENSTVGKFCTDNGFGNVTACRCIHRLKVDLNSIVEFIVVNVDDQIPHPIHLHGHKFHIVDMGVYDKKPIPGWVKNGGIPNETHSRPPYKDTCILPYPGYVRLRFRADNPGFWLFHCHFDWHLETGMSLILQVGELNQMVKPPKDFPKCSNYQVSKING